MSRIIDGSADVRVPTASDAKDLLREARGDMNRYKQYTRIPYKKGYEVHNQQSVREIAAGNDLQHLKWYDGKAQGHVYDDKPN